MASIRKRGAKWQAQVRRQGSSPLSRTFHRKADAETWARQMEAEADRRGLPADPRELQRLTVGDLIERYRGSVTPKKRGAVVEAGRLGVMLRHRLAKVSLASVAPALFTAYRDERLRTCKPETVRRELSLLQHVFELARREWSVPLTANPVSAVQKPPSDKPRERRLEGAEADRLIEATRRCRNKLIEPYVRLAIETGMRRGELLNVYWRDVDLERRILHIPQTKNGHPRTIPLSSAALAVLRGLRGVDEQRVLPLSLNAVKLAWKRLLRRAGVSDLHFHDLRHEAVSRFFERGLSVPEVALISGHRDYRMLFRYTHLRPEQVAEKLA